MDSSIWFTMSNAIYGNTENASNTLEDLDKIDNDMEMADMGIREEMNRRRKLLEEQEEKKKEDNVDSKDANNINTKALNK